MPAPEGTCSWCAVEHEPESPHNQQSLFWQYRFYGEHNRWPSWKDAMAHCDAATQAAWTKALKERGVDVERAAGTPLGEPPR